MRNFLLVGTVGLALALGAVGADAQSVRDRPESSPRALTSQDIGALLGAPGVGSFLTEGRAAYISGAANFGPQNNGNGALKNAAPISQQFDAIQVR